ncbi:MAG: hypothetical protein IPO92_02705 [Saprospiraceae bacterium]|nr:hypothetical protein [Saprospiraceae bacterium]
MNALLNLPIPPALPSFEAYGNKAGKHILLKVKTGVVKNIYMYFGNVKS